MVIKKLLLLTLLLSGQIYCSQTVAKEISTAVTTNQEYQSFLRSNQLIKESNSNWIYKKDMINQKIAANTPAGFTFDFESKSNSFNSGKTIVTTTRYVKNDNLWTQIETWTTADPSYLTWQNAALAAGTIGAGIGLAYNQGYLETNWGNGPALTQSPANLVIQSPSTTEATLPKPHATPGEAALSSAIGTAIIMPVVNTVTGAYQGNKNYKNIPAGTVDNLTRSQAIKAGIKSSVKSGLPLTPAITLGMAGHSYALQTYENNFMSSDKNGQPSALGPIAEKAIVSGALMGVTQPVIDAGTGAINGYRNIPAGSTALKAIAEGAKVGLKSGVGLVKTPAIMVGMGALTYGVESLVDYLKKSEMNAAQIQTDQTTIPSQS